MKQPWLMTEERLYGRAVALALVGFGLLIVAALVGLL